MYSSILETVQKKLESKDCKELGDKLSLETLLNKSEVSEDVYMKALHWFYTKNGHAAVLLERSPAEIYINNYSETMMRAWEANLDVQYVTSVYACVMYVASYVSKPEKTLGDVLKSVSSSSQHLGAKASMKRTAKKFLTHREVSAQEAVYRLMSLPLTKGSREVIFIPTDLPEKRIRLFKPMKQIDLLEDDDPDVFQVRKYNFILFFFYHFTEVSMSNLDLLKPMGYTYVHFSRSCRYQHQ